MAYPLGGEVRGAESGARIPLLPQEGHVGPGDTRLEDELATGEETGDVGSVLPQRASRSPRFAVTHAAVVGSERAESGPLRAWNVGIREAVKHGLVHACRVLAGNGPYGALPRHAVGGAEYTGRLTGQHGLPAEIPATSE